MSSAGLGPYPYDDDEPPMRERAPRIRVPRLPRVAVWVGPSALVAACVGAFVWVAVALNPI